MKQKLQLSLISFGRFTLFFAFLLIVPFRVFAAPPPTEPPANSGVNVNIAGEAYVKGLPGANQSSTQSIWFRQAFANIIGSLLSIVMTIAAILLLLYLVMGALGWITSAGDKGKLEEARNRMTTAVIGIIVLSAVVVLFMLVQQFLGICVLDFWGTACVTPPTP